MQEFEEYEFQICDYHRNNANHIVWHWKFIPEEDLFASGFITNYNTHRLKRKERLEEDKNNIREYGLDGLALDNNGVYHGLQAKCWNPKKYLTASDLGTFLAVIFTRLLPRNPDSIGYLYHTCRLQADVKDSFTYTPNLKHILLPYSKKEEEVVNNIETDFELYPPQKEALIAMKNGWEENGLISMPCALGKTVLLGNYVRDVKPKHIIILSPLRVLTKQMLDRIHPFVPDKTAVLVDSDEGGTTDFDVVVESFENPCLMSITYESFINIFIEQNLENEFIDLEDCLIVVDEAHNLIQYYEIMDYLNELGLKSLLLTATPSETMMEYLCCDVIYDYPMSEAIKENYVCDYFINVPVLDLVNERVDIDIPDELKHLDNDITIKSLFLLSGMLETGSRKCIVYCCSIEECEIFNTIFTEISREYHGIECWSSSITANTSVRKREEILKDFQNNNSKISILSSVRILNEGVNIVKCDSVFITKVNDNEIVAVQRMCRANRKDRENPNKVANCFVWADDLNKTVEMLQYLKTNDETRFFNRIKARSGNYERKGDIVEINKDIDYTTTLRDYISVRSLSFEDVWTMRLEEVSKYIDENDKRPSTHDKDKNVRKLGRWIQLQQHNYRKQIMKNHEIRQLWVQFVEKYEKYFLSNEDKWKIILQEVSIYIDENKKRPSNVDKDDNIRKLAKWISINQVRYFGHDRIMKVSEIRLLWKNFMEKYSKYFTKCEEKWKVILQELIKYIDDNNKRPSQNEKDKKIKSLANWIQTQQTCYLKKIKIMQNNEIKILWERFLKKYEKHFISNEQNWKDILYQVYQYIDENNKRPSLSDVNENIRKLGIWINHQQNNYSRKKGNMKNLEICQLWEQFITKYEKYFLSNEQYWKITLQEVSKYIDENDKRPSNSDKDKKLKKLAAWINTQQHNYPKKEKIMKEHDIRLLWEQFTEKYSDYFK